MLLSPSAQLRDTTFDEVVECFELSIFTKNRLRKGTLFRTDPPEVLPTDIDFFQEIRNDLSTGSSWMVTHWAGMAVNLASIRWRWKVYVMLDPD